MYYLFSMPRITNVVSFLETFGPLSVSILLIFWAAMDILYDIQQANGLNHIVLETIIFFMGFILNLYFVDKVSLSVRGLRQAHQQIAQNLQVSALENEKLKQEQQKFREGLTIIIDEQLQRWGLSKSEVEISFLLLKGLSNKEIAEVRSTSESTVRLQCSSIYKKSQLSSRSELAAYFIEDMLDKPVH